MANKKSNKSKRLTGIDIINETAKLDKLKKITLEDGRYTEIYTNISIAKIQEMINSFLKFISELTALRNESGEKLDETDIMDFLNLHMILHFTTVAVEIPESIEEKVDIFEKLLKHDIMEQLFESFDKKDVERTYGRFYNTMEKYQELIQNNEEYRQLFKQKVRELGLDNEDVINEVLFNGELRDGGRVNSAYPSS